MALHQFLEIVFGDCDYDEYTKSVILIVDGRAIRAWMNPGDLGDVMPAGKRCAVLDGDLRKGVEGLKHRLGVEDDDGPTD